MLEISVRKSQKIHKIPASVLQYIKKSTEIILSDFNESSAYCSIMICDDDFIQKINREYRKKNSPTDVISFAFDDNEKNVSAIRSLGEIIISAETAWKQAIEFEISYEEELLRLNVHGMLHLLGFDHERSYTAHKEMFKRQDRYMSQFMYEFYGKSSSLI